MIGPTTNRLTANSTENAKRSASSSQTLRIPSRIEDHSENAEPSAVRRRRVRMSQNAVAEMANVVASMA